MLLERARLAAKGGDGAALRDAVARLNRDRAAWSTLVREQFDAFSRAVAAADLTEAARALVFLRNVLLPTPAFQEGLTRVSISTALFGEPFERFLALAPPSATPSPPDEALTFGQEPMGGAPTPSWTTVLTASLNGSDAPAVFAAAGSALARVDGQEASLPQPAGGAAPAVTPQGLLALDWNHDFRIDLLAAGNGGLRLLLQGDGGAFSDATAIAMGAGADPLPDVFGAWAADLEMDGDLDVIVGVVEGAPVVLRNNGDGTWRWLRPFGEVSGLRGFGWGDLDGDGDPDAALVDAAGDLHLFSNQQAGVLRPVETAPVRRGVIALAVGDVNGDSVLDVVTLGADGAIRRTSTGRDGWVDQPLATWPDWSGRPLPGTYRVLLGDLDNNGALDVVASGAERSRVWLGDARNELRLLAAAPDLDVHSVADMNTDGQLDLVGLSGGQPVRLLGRGTAGYHWQVFRPRAQPIAGDQRINSFGIGGDIEVRSGLLVQKQTIGGSPVHFGLGARTTVDVARIVWPNGVVQAEFDRGVDDGHGGSSVVGPLPRRLWPVLLMSAAVLGRGT